MLSKTAPEPLYWQLSLRLKQAIKNGEWMTGDQLPSERELARDYGISRDTARHALQCLVNEGLVQPWQGAGSFVAPQK